MLFLQWRLTMPGGRLAGIVLTASHRMEGLRASGEARLLGVSAGRISALAAVMGAMALRAVRGGGAPPAAPRAGGEASQSAARRAPARRLVTSPSAGSSPSEEPSAASGSSPSWEAAAASSPSAYSSPSASMSAHQQPRGTRWTAVGYWQ